MNDPTASPNRLLFRFSKIMGLLCIATATAPSFCFVMQVQMSAAAIVRFAVAIFIPLVIGGAGALTIDWQRYSNRPMGKALVWEMGGLLTLLLAWLATLWVAQLSDVDLWSLFVLSVPLALAWLLKLGCWVAIAVGPRVAWYRWFDAISMALGLIAIAAWLAQSLFILCHGGGNDSASARLIVLFDALPPGIVGGGMLVAAAVARHRRRLRGARLLEFGGLAALSLSVLLTSGVGALFASDRTFVDLAPLTCLFLGAKIISTVVIGGASWLVVRRISSTEPCLSESVSGPTGNTVATPSEPRPVRRLPDLLSFLAVLFTWFCVVPISPSFHMSLIIPGPSMFVAGFPVGLVGVLALLAAGLLRAGRDRSRIAPLELFGVIALTMVFVAAALPFANTGAFPNPSVAGLVVTSWVLFGLAIGAKLICIIASMFRRRERMQFSLLGLLALMIGCGALVMYWRLWRS